MPKVIVFKETLLPPSETFIAGQVNALDRYQALLCGLERSLPSLPLNKDTLLLAAKAGKLGSLRAKVYRKTGIAPLFHGRAQRFHPDLVHAHFANGGYSAMPLARSLGVPLVVTLHGADVTVRSNRSDRYKGLAEQAVRFICVSEFIRNCAHEAGFPPEKLLVHYIGIDKELFTPGASPVRPKRVLFVGRLVEKKGCEYLLRAMQVVQEQSSGCDLTIIGDGPLRSSLQALARELKLRCEFYGVQAAWTVRDKLQQSRVFCVPSVRAANGDSEGLGLVFAEAQAMGVPVVSTLHGGIPEVVSNGVTGLLVPERNYHALADALLAVLNDDVLWEQFRLAAPSHLNRQFNIRLQTQALESIYDQVILDASRR